MSEYIVQRETLTALGDEIRELAGKTEELSLETMRGDVSAANEEVAEQTGLLEQIQTALAAKGGGTVETWQFVMEDGSTVTKDVVVS